jgi:class 3 adenylate cyclase/tRNA A-37 threonylcarbamoyl transferase component Bud32
MGTVWRAWDERLKRRVAIKQLRPDLISSEGQHRLLREAQATARLNHPAVVHVYDLVEEGGALWVVMEMVDGKTLRRLIEQQGPLPVPQAVQLGREIAEGLSEAHAQGILHRDLKVSNVMVTPLGHAKILDFGLAKELFGKDGDELEETVSSPDAILGTLYAMSPEQVHGYPLDERSDLFSLGSLLYEVLAGEAPFRGETPAATLNRVLTFRPPPLPEVRVEVSWELSLLIEKLLEKDPKRRPANAKAVIEALAALGTTIHRPRRDAPPPPGSGGSTIIEPVPPALHTGLPSSPGSERRLRGGEHRLLTVVCCGMAGLDEASGATNPLDLEAIPDAMDALRALARDVCKEHCGVLGPVHEDWLLLYFGHPQAREDDVQRALRAACALASRSGEVSAGFGPHGRTRLALRIAVHTGGALALTRSGQEEQLLAGVTLDTVREIQSAAPAGEVVVSAASRLLSARAFATKLLTSVQVPGSGDLLAVYQVLGPMDPQQGGSEPVTPLVARERELELLIDRFHHARAGTGQVVMISGEPGIGKSRLVLALRERLAAEGPVWWTAYGALATQNAPLAPLIGLLDRHLLGGPTGGDHASDPARKLRLLEEALDRYGLPPADTIPLLAPLLSLPADGPYPTPAGLSPEATRERTFEALTALLAAVAERAPLVLIVEDLHWVDSSTLDFLRLLLDEIAALPILLVATFQPELQASWRHRSDLTQLSLSRLTDRETAALIDQTLAGHTLSDAVRRQILARTDGVPLFAEELTKAFLESAWTGEPEAVPATLATSLAVRLDRTGPGKEVAQTASALGRTFSFESLAAVSSLTDEELQEGLDRLIAAGLVHRRRGAGRRAQYTFKHALVQDAAYASLLRRDRQALHLEAARSLEAGAAEPGLLAHHWSQAVDPGNPDPVLVQKAVSSLLAAAEGMQRLGVVQESLAHLDAALGFIRTLPHDLAHEAERAAALLSPLLAQRRGSEPESD